MFNSLKKLIAQNAVAFLALFVALGSTATAAAVVIDGKNIKANTVTTKQVRNGSLTRTDFAKNQIPAGAPGAAGPQGPKGDTGVQGIQGIRGADGLQGAPGLNTAARTVETISGTRLGSLVFASPYVPSSGTPGPDYVAATPMTVVYENDDSQFVTVAIDGSYQLPDEFRVLYEFYDGGDCSGRMFVEPTRSVTNQLFRLNSSATIAYVATGQTASVPTEAASTGSGSCAQLSSPAQNLPIATRVGALTPIGEAVTISID